MTKKGIEELPVSNLMKIVKTKSVVLNLYYVVGDSGKNDIMRTENFGEIFFEVAHNSFGTFVLEGIF